VSLFAANFKDSVINQLLADFGNYLRAKLPPLCIALALVWVARRWLRPRMWRARLTGYLAPVLLIATFGIPAQHRHLQAAPPDVLYLNAIGGLLATQLGFTEQSNQMRPRARQSLPVPALHPVTTPKRNVLFVILESVRAGRHLHRLRPGLSSHRGYESAFSRPHCFPADALDGFHHGRVLGGALVGARSDRVARQPAHLAADFRLRPCRRLRHRLLDQPEHAVRQRATVGQELGREQVLQRDGSRAHLRLGHGRPRGIFWRSA